MRRSTDVLLFSDVFCLLSNCRSSLYAFRTCVCTSDTLSTVRRRLWAEDPLAYLGEPCHTAPSCSGLTALRTTSSMSTLLASFSSLGMISVSLVCASCRTTRCGTRSARSAPWSFVKQRNKEIYEIISNGFALRWTSLRHTFNRVVVLSTVP